jgi:uncharacterized damage-inducible protein DinB
VWTPAISVETPRFLPNEPPMPFGLLDKVRDMISMLQDLVRHKAYANAALLSAIRRNAKAAHDEALRTLLHHIILANRFWLLSCLGQSFAIEDESRIPDSLDVVAAQYRPTHSQEWEWISHATDADVARSLEGPLIPGNRCSVAQALMQVCMHSHGHRAQCATRLRLLGGMPPATDFIGWLTERPDPDWS